MAITMAGMGQVSAPIPSNRYQEKSAWTRILEFFAALGEGIRLARAYDTLVLRGIRPEIAVRRVFEQLSK